MSKKKQNANIGSLLISEQNCWCFVFFVVLFCLVFIKYLLQSELNKSYSNVKLIVYWWVLVKQEQLLPVELLRHNEMSFVRFLLKPEMAFCPYKPPFNMALCFYKAPFPALSSNRTNDIPLCLNEFHRQQHLQPHKDTWIYYKLYIGIRFI